MNVDDWPDWYLTGVLRSIGDYVVRTRPTDAQLLTAWAAYGAAAPASEDA